jgi:hypothetical protein
MTRAPLDGKLPENREETLLGGMVTTTTESPKSLLALFGGRRETTGPAKTSVTPSTSFSLPKAFSASIFLLHRDRK